MTTNDGASLAYERLIALLPHGQYPHFSADVQGVRLVGEPNQAFVAPSLAVADGDEDGAKVVVLSAPAAAGKSTLAHQLAHDTGGLLLDLAEWNVGNNFLPGTLYETFGQDVGEVLGEISSGALALIVDAVDETQLRSGESNFEQFLGDIADYLSKAATNMPAVVILGRADTAEYVSLYLEDRSVPYVRLAIEYFDESRAKDFIDVQLDASLGPSGAHRAQRDRFEGIRDKLWAALRQAVASVDDADGGRSFLGYPPVLTAIASFLSEANLQQLESDVERIGDTPLGDPTQPWSFISGIVSAILLREQSKVGLAIRERLEPATVSEEVEWNALFSPEEQCSRVAAWIAGTGQDGVPAPKMSVSVRAEYLALIDTAIPQHPFIGPGREYANSVFHDFVLATELVCEESERRQRARADLTRSTNLPTPLLGYFLLSKVVDRPLEGADVGIIYDSISAREANAGNVQIVVRDATVGRDNLVEVVVGPPGSAAEFTADCTKSPVAFLRRLRAALVETGGAVVLGSGRGDFLLGPDVDIQAGLLTVEAGFMRVVGGPDGPVRLRADLYEGPPGVLDLRVVAPDSLTISWPDASYPWVDYRGELEVPRDDEDAYVKFRHLSHILRYFVRHGREPLQAGKQLIDNVAVGQSPGAQAVFAALLESGVVNQRGNVYIIEVAELAARGVNYVDLRNQRMTDSLRAFIDTIDL